MRYDHYQLAVVLKAMEEDRSRSVKDSLNLSKERLHFARLDTLKPQKGKTEQNSNMHNSLIRPGGTVSSPPSV